MKRLQRHTNESGFTLLLAALVASITLALGAAIYSIAVKQVALSSIGRDSQFAFYAADTAAECTLYNDIRLNKFPTSTPSGTYSDLVTCNGVSADVVVVRNDETSSGSFWDSNAECPATDTPCIFVVPSGYTSLTMTIDGASGGGGSGRASALADGQNGTAGTPTDVTIIDVLRANSGGGGGRGQRNGTNGSPGSSGPTNPTGGTGGSVIPVGSGGPGFGGTGNGGDGGRGGRLIQSFTPATLLPGTNVTVVVGRGGTQGASTGGGSSAGLPGTKGRVYIEWIAQSSTWTSTVFTFSLNLNNDCATVTFTKRRSGNTIRNTIHSDGLNVSCAAQFTDPHALQRSVELLY